MSEFVSKSILFSEPEKNLVIASDLSETVTIAKGILGLSVIKIERSKREVIKNITFSKVSDSSYQKTYDKIEFLDRSTKAEQIEQTGETEIELDLNSHSDGNSHTDSDGKLSVTKAQIIRAGVVGWTNAAPADDVNEATNTIFNYKVDESKTFPVDPVEALPIPLEEINLSGVNNDATFKSIIPNELSVDSSSEGTFYDDTTGKITGIMSNAKSRTPAKNIFIYNAFNFNYSKQALETNSICEVYFVRNGFLFEMLKSNTGFTVNGKAYSNLELRNEAPGKNYTRKIEDYKIEFEDKIFLDKSSFVYVTTLSTGDNSNYNYEIPVNPDYEYILFIPSASPKSVSIKKPKLEIFFTKLLEDTQASDIPPTDEGNFVYPSGENTPQNVGDYAALYNHLNKNAVEFFVKKYNEFIEKFYDYDSINDESSDRKFYVLKNIQANINFNLEEVS